MRKSLVYSFLLWGLSWLPAAPVAGQGNILGNLLGQESPVFQSTILPATESGEVKMVLYFTHSKIDDLEVSVWLTDQGAALQSKGERQMAGALRLLGNRQPDTVQLRGLTDRHFYTIGIDYRNPRGLSRKFSSEVLQGGYLYQYTPPAAISAVAPPPDIPSPSGTSPCEDPSLLLRLEPAGFCGTDNRPAVMIQCDNCRDMDWAFSVETRTWTGEWRPLRADGQPQPASGPAVRIEPLCTLSPGEHYIRVVAWGENCKNPVFQTMGAPVVIPETAIPPVAAEPAFAAPASPRRPLPDTCQVVGEAILDGQLISGILELAPYSPCAEFQPYAQVRYIHPGHRDIVIDHIPLSADRPTPFELGLDNIDLARGIHTIQVVVFVQPEPEADGLPTASFWIKALPTQDLRPKTGLPTSGPILADAGATTGVDFSRRGGDPGDSPSSVRTSAGLAGYARVEDLQLVYDPRQPTRPVYITWTNPAACRNQGCAYTIWAGEDPSRLRRLTSGNQGGLHPMESLTSALPQDQYFEVVIQTVGGVHKAAYRMGLGPVDKQPAAPASQPNDDRPGPAAASMLGGDLAARMGTPVAAADRRTPSLPLARFEACRYRRDFFAEAEQPVLTGDQVRFRYDYDGKGYRYTLFHQPAGSDGWFVAPGTEELQASPEFAVRVLPEHTGRYLMLTYHPKKQWGCLSSPPGEALELRVEE